MVRIKCPFCGERDYSEFKYYGDASKVRPDFENESIDDWCRHVFVRDNPMGWHVEYWHHVHGCRAWLRVERHTVTHRIATVDLVRGEPKQRETSPSTALWTRAKAR
ncbi:MAG: sarcosine oxidase subunit delta [Alphaproteobacteria bacterium]|nr:sarcosine oxidase subunit delta [Alphaproteobacteria bacterium]